MSILSLLFFYDPLEEFVDHETQQKIGYIRIIDLKRNKTIEKVEVSCVQETFFFLRQCLESIAESVTEYDYPQSEQCFAVKWYPEIVKKIRIRDFQLLCEEIDMFVRNYIHFLKQSGRLLVAS